MRRYISAYILDAPYHIDKTYDYYIPEHLEGDIIPGSIISVPFGVSNRRVFALATEFKDERAPSASLPCIGFAPGAKGSPFFLPSGVAPVFNP